ncbi:ABC transporter ATP-binding protein [Candidatus Peregrinibacteria bacterium]|nr:ABC transporter ATP-binding protein [Candidatus Peregrinibacteria bacterium]
MENFRSQTWLYQQRNKIRQEVVPVIFEKTQKQYLRRLLKKFQKQICVFLILAFGTILLEIGIPFISDIFLRHQVLALNIRESYQVFFLLLLLLGVYGTLSYGNIRIEKTILVRIMNELRKSWFESFIRKSLFSLTNQEKSVLITKISFHFTLLQQGITNSVISMVHWGFLSLGLLIITFFLNKNLFILSGLLLPISFLICFLAYVVAKYYVSQEQTMYSKILQHMSLALEEFPLVKFHHLEKKKLRQFNEMVEIDSYFRIRREIWLKFGNTILFGSLVLFGAAAYLLEVYFPFLHFEYAGQGFVFAMVFGLMIKLLYLSLRIGLYLPPLKLGAILSIPNFSLPPFLHRKNLKLDAITFRALRASLEKNTILRKASFTFEKGARILFFGQTDAARIALSRIFTANAPKNLGNPWVILMDSKRYLYNAWKKKYLPPLFIDPEFRTERTFLEVISQKNPEDMSSDEIQSIIEKLGAHPEFQYIFDHTKALGRKIPPYSLSLMERGLLQLAHALIHPPLLLVIDSVFLDLNHPGINAAIQTIAKELSETVIICFSREENSILSYDQKHSF